MKEGVIINIYDIDDKIWDKLKGSLEGLLKSGVFRSYKSLKEQLGYSRIVRYKHKINCIFLEGGKIPIKYDFDNDELFIWNKNTNQSSSDLSLTNLNQIKEIIKYWYDNCIKYL